MNSVMGDPATNMDRVEAWAAKAHSRGASFAVFPEECLTGSLNKSDTPPEKAREIAAQGVELAMPRLKGLCERLRLTVVLGTIEAAPKGLWNSMLIVGPKGPLTTYRKLHMPNETEERWFTPGDRQVVVTSQGWTFSVGICFDLNVPDLFRTAALAGAEFMLFGVGNSGSDDAAARQRNMYSRLMCGFAAANGLYVFYCNQAGRSGKASLCGLAFSMDPRGDLLDSSAGGEGMVVTSVSRELVQDLRELAQTVTLRKLRPDVYSNPLIVKE